jgi:hypothetical protein
MIQNQPQRRLLLTFALLSTAAHAQWLNHRGTRHATHPRWQTQSQRTSAQNVGWQVGPLRGMDV